MKNRIKIDKITMQHPLDVYELMQLILKREHKVDRNKEYFWVLSLSQANKILSLELVALGANNRVSASAADVLAVPLQKEAKGVILIHNHPSGSLEPSERDKDYTNKMIQVCRIMNTPMLDYVIITEHNYFSFAKSGLLEELEASLKYVPPYEIEAMFYNDGREEEKSEIARNMLSRGLDMQLICEMTGLSEAEIGALK